MKRLIFITVVILFCLQISCSKKDSKASHKTNLTNSPEAIDFSVEIAGEEDSEIAKQIRTGVDRVSKPLDEIPAHVKSIDGRLTFFADFDHRSKIENSDDNPIRSRGWNVPIYIINRTEQDVHLDHQDGDFYLKLEYEVEPCKWVRAQPHSYSFCGNSYEPRILLAADSYTMQNGYLPKEGQQSKIRYSLYSQQIKVSTNVGFGPINHDATLFAKYDEMSIRQGDVDFLTKVAHNEIEDKKYADLFTRMKAINRLKSGGFDAEKIKKMEERLDNEMFDIIKPK